VMTLKNDNVKVDTAVILGTKILMT
jgi:hypothetical protein